MGGRTGATAWGPPDPGVGVIRVERRQAAAKLSIDRDEGRPASIGTVHHRTDGVQPSYPYDAFRFDSELLQRFGADVRRCRLAAGMSQEMLEDLAAVDQTSISRLERGLAPRMAMVKLVRLGLGLGRALPLGNCPHDHDCAWQPTAGGLLVSPRRDGD